MIYDLPTSLEIGGKGYEIRWDYRATLDIMVALSDPELDEQDKAEVALTIFYPDARDIPQEHMQEAIEKCMWFINCGEEPDGKKGPKMLDWEQDFNLIVGPVNRIIGQETRAMEHLHWWTWMAAYMEIGECLFSQVVSIRDKQARGKKLEKYEQEWLRRNRKLVDFKRKYTQADNDLLKQWI